MGDDTRPRDLLGGAAFYTGEGLTNHLSGIFGAVPRHQAGSMFEAHVFGSNQRADVTPGHYFGLGTLTSTNGAQLSTAVFARIDRFFDYRGRDGHIGVALTIPTDTVRGNPAVQSQAYAHLDRMFNALSVNAERTAPTQNFLQSMQSADPKWAEKVVTHFANVPGSSSTLTFYPPDKLERVDTTPRGPSGPGPGQTPQQGGQQGQPQRGEPPHAASKADDKPSLRSSGNKYAALIAPVIGLAAALIPKAAKAGVEPEGANGSDALTATFNNAADAATILGCVLGPSGCARPTQTVRLGMRLTMWCMR